MRLLRRLWQYLGFSGNIVTFDGRPLAFINTQTEARLVAKRNVFGRIYLEQIG